MSAQITQSTSVTTPPQPSAELNEFILAEFQYIADSTNQSSEDRARVSNYYLVTIGAAVAAIFSNTLNNPQSSVNIAIGVGFIALAFLGWFTLMTLIRLRAGWMAGANAMDAIKEYYIKIYDKAQLDTAFEWERKDLPAPGKLDSVAFWTAASVILVDSVMLGLGAIYCGTCFVPKLSNETLLTIAILVIVITISIQLGIYWYRLSPFKKP